MMNPRLDPEVTMEEVEAAMRRGFGVASLAMLTLFAALGLLWWLWGAS